MCIEKIYKEEKMSLNDKVDIYREILDSSSLNDKEKISKLPLLTKEEEFELASQRDKDEYSADLYKTCFLMGNLRLVRKISSSYFNATGGFHDLAQDDLMQEGFFGLIKATEKFEHERGYKFSTYAVYWINQSISRAIKDKGSTIRYPVHLHEQLAKYKKSIGKIFSELGYMPSNQEIADMLEITKEEIEYLELKSISNLVSLDKAVTKLDDEDTALINALRDDSAIDPEEESLNKVMAEQLKEILEAILTPKQRKVIEERFGITGEPPKTLQEVGNDFGVTRERIRQIEKIALRKMRNYFRKNKVYSL